MLFNWTDPPDMEGNHHYYSVVAIDTSIFRHMHIYIKNNNNKYKKLKNKTKTF